MPKSRFCFCGCSLLAAWLGSGCSSIIDAHSQKTDLMKAYDTGNIKVAAIDFADKAESRRDSGDAIMWFLEDGTARFEGSEYDKSLASYEAAEKKIDEFDHRATVSARDVGAEAGSAMTNLNALPYRGFYYDRILLNAYKSLAYFSMNKPDGALVELRRMRDTQKKVSQLFAAEIDQERKNIAKEQNEMLKEAAPLNHSGQEYEGQQPQKGKNNANATTGGNISTQSLLQNDVVGAAMAEAKQKSEKTYGNLVNPFASYLSAIGYLYERNTSEALVDFRNLYRMDKNNPLTNRDYVTLGRQLAENLPDALKDVKPYPYSLTSNIVFVIFANGRGPALKQTKFQIILPWVGYTGVAFPQYEYYPATYTSLRVSGSGGEQQTVLVSDMDNVASQEYVERLPLMITRIVISYLTKELASLVATQAASSQGTGAQIVAYGVTGLYKYLFNTADTRCWETLPKQYQITHLPIPVDRKLTITPLAGTMTEQSISLELKKSTRFAIVYIRAGSGKILSQKLIELQ